MCTPEDGAFLPRVAKATVAPRPPTLGRRQLSRASGVQTAAIGRQLSRQRSRDSTSGAQEGTSQPDGAAVSKPEQDVEAISLPVSGTLRNSTSRQKAILLVMAMNDLLGSMALAILAPFFPAEANSKGISNAVSGWVFGVYALVQCIMSPIFGRAIPKLGPRFLSLAGQFFAGGCTILFGLLQYVPTTDGPLVFIVLCFVLRIFAAVGSAAAGTSSFAIAAHTFPENPATVFGLLETAVGFGLMLGPALGGVLFEVGGFMLPFVVIGSLMVGSVSVAFCILPADVAESDADSAPGSMSNLLRIPAVLVACFAVFIACMAWVMLDPTLEPHLRPLNLSPSIIGLIFLLMAACYAICSPIWGWIADNVPDSSPMMVVGFLVTSAGFLVLGPSPLLGLGGFNALWMDILALIVIGLSVSLAVVPTYDKILDAADKAGIEDSMGNYSAVAGMWNASYSFGEFVGPVMAGWLVGSVGFAWTMTLASALCLLMGIVMLILYIYEKNYGPTGRRAETKTETRTDNDSERTPLLRDSVNA